MKILVFVKQVPDTDDVRLDPRTGNLMRDGVQSIINPFDANGVEAALQLKAQCGGQVVAISMGPPQADDVLKKALAMGCDESVLISDRALGGADTLAAYTDYFAPYVCANDDVIGEAYKASDDLWIGESPLPMVFIYNKTLIDEADVPTTWEGLCDEALKGKIAYASPAKSGSAYTQLCTMLFSQPTLDEGWALVEKFIANLDGKIQDSSGNCHKLVASGEYAMGVTIEKSAVLYADNPDIGFLYPEKNSAVPDGVALIKNCPNEENAKLFIDFVTSLDCQTAQNADWARRPVRSDLSPVGLCELSELDLAYAPPYSSAKDPVNMAGFMMENLAGGLLQQFHWDMIDTLPRDGSITLLDTRTAEEYQSGHIEGTIHIPVDELRERMNELETGKLVYVICQSGLRSYIACRILEQNGFACRNLAGGYRLYESVMLDRCAAEEAFPCGMDKR